MMQSLSTSGVFQPAEAAATPDTPAGGVVRVVTYNVLSPTLAAPPYFPFCNPDDLVPDVRLERVKRKLLSEIERGAILCLQEVSRSWTGNLHAFFVQHQYSMIVAPYGSKFNDYMGVAIAFPLSGPVELVEAHLDRLSDTKSWGQVGQRPPKKELAWFMDVPFLSRGFRAIQALGRELSRDPNASSKTVKKPSWDVARNRFNVMICARFRFKSEEAQTIYRKRSREFLLATYHMPCVFWDQSVMAIHTALACENAMTRAAGAPYILAGDFNLKPSDPMYNLITLGQLPSNFVLEQPENTANGEKENAPFDVRVSRPMMSVYAVLNGREPDFTNNARIKDQDPFVETLDYIFASHSDWKVHGVHELPERAHIKGPYPDATEPSDHLLLAADLELIR
ncbi:Carbon catabolite repressor protein 4-like 4 [Porphyridium purpureum]|uniref:Carbon catabolite repressor protein 4-like 4 n=1 Tax=Porphyridium purpureum TaxID=35688 RepID=A0A5J4YQ76_PORPP|nr:Carbon catabolite repressor protein 4-like 4 [Porphyridium purpureum]|eukprot:POR8770..scf236_6